MTTQPVADNREIVAYHALVDPRPFPEPEMVAGEIGFVLTDLLAKIAASAATQPGTVDWTSLRVKAEHSVDDYTKDFIKIRAGVKLDPPTAV